MNRIYNFSAGPAILPVPVLEEASKGIVEIDGSGMGVLELSHRGKIYDAIHRTAMADTLDVMGLSADDYQVLFLQGGATGQFAMLAYNYLDGGKKADYVNKGAWAKKAVKEAQAFGTVNELKDFSGFSSDAVYAHITTNETIAGTQLRKAPDTGGVPLVADMSSDFLSHPLDFGKFDMIYAGAQKNAGPAGLAIVVMKKSFLEKAREDGAGIWRYKDHAANDSLLNTPPAFPIYVYGLVLKWIKEQGGLAKVAEVNERKAGYIYDVIDKYPDVWVGAAAKEERSWMNVTFVPKDEGRFDEFLAGAKERKMDGLKGHRSVGGFRASIYNAFPEEGCKALAEYMEEFAKK